MTHPIGAEATTAEPPPTAVGARTAAFMLVLLLGLQPVTTDVMLVALPALAGGLHAGMASVQLTMSALILAFGIAQLFWGPVADRFGRRPVLLAGLAIYLASALAACAAGSIAQVVLARIVQGAAMSAAVVCARAMIRDLYLPREGAMVMARALGGLGLLAIASPLFGGLLVARFGWRAAPGAMAFVGALALAVVGWRLPETIRQPRPDATRWRPLFAQTRRIVAHPGFRAWAVLVSCAYGGLFIYLSASAFVLIRVLGLGPATAGALVSLVSVCYIGGTLIARRWIARCGLAGAVRRAAVFSATAGLLFLAEALLEWRHPAAVIAPMLVFALGHGVHQPCGQTGAVAPFPHAAGLASALAGFATAIVAFAVGLWLGVALDGGVRPFALGMSLFAGLTALVAAIWVQRAGEPAHG